ncbi:hypothetical protein ABEB36_001144 [Hypothenemus hampei]|uniref:Fibronectin type-III domain-containing protein n=1 Tax=Hypothenemus hampei TaxID=57062 RepID=A0ABD1FG71_HYPHA
MQKRKNNMAVLYLIVVINILLTSVQGLCVPDQVEDFVLNDDQYLVWNVTNSCTIAYFNLRISDLEDRYQYEYQIGNTSHKFYVGDFYKCKSYNFNLRPVTFDAVLGPEALLNATIPPLYGDLIIIATGINSIYNDFELNITWDFYRPIAENCVSYYRVIHNVNNETPVETYVTSKNFTIEQKVACSNYTVLVNAIIQGDYQLEGQKILYVIQGEMKVPSVPEITSLITTTDSVTMILKLEPYTANYCKLIELYISSLGVPKNLSYIHIPIEDNILRPDVNVTLTGLNRDSVYYSYIQVQSKAGKSERIMIDYRTKVD